MEIWLPVEGWNGKFLGTGSGGAGGLIAHDSLLAGINKKYAVANTDLGTSVDGKRPTFDFGIGEPEKQIDWAYRSTHLMTVVSKHIIATYYGKQAQYAYFKGCSSGGLQAMSEVIRFPDDYDGVIAEAPGNNRTNIHMNLIWAHQAAHGNPAGYIPPAKIPAIHTAVMNACDGLDGMVDGVIDDPRRCQYDPAGLQCIGDDQYDCLTKPQIAALRKIYAGPRNPRTGKQYFPGLPRGAEASPLGLRRILMQDSPTFADRTKGLLAWSAASTWNGDPVDFDFDADAEAVNRDLAFLNATNPDLAAFKKRGGKLILWAGTADGVPHIDDLIDYYDAVTETMGGVEKTRQFARLFVAPGVYHCSGGPGPNRFDMLDAIDAWVDGKRPPERILATKYRNDDPAQGILRTRPLCPYPRVATWNGRGSTDDAANFICQSPLQ